MARQVKLKPRPRGTVVAGGKHGSEQGAGQKFGRDEKLDREAASTPRDNRGVTRAMDSDKRVNRPPEMVPSKRDFSGDQASAVRAAPAHYAHRPIVRGTMHARKPGEPMQQGQRESPSAARNKHLRTDNDDTE